MECQQKNDEQLGFAFVGIAAIVLILLMTMLTGCAFKVVEDVRNPALSSKTWKVSLFSNESSEEVGSTTK